MSESAKGYTLTESDKALIHGMAAGGSNIAAVHFDGQMLVDMVAARREIGDKLKPLLR